MVLSCSHFLSQARSEAFTVKLIEALLTQSSFAWSLAKEVYLVVVFVTQCTCLRRLDTAKLLPAEKLFTSQTKSLSQSLQGRQVGPYGSRSWTNPRKQVQRPVVGRTPVPTSTRSPEPSQATPLEVSPQNKKTGRKPVECDTSVIGKPFPTSLGGLLVESLRVNAFQKRHRPLSC